MTRTDERVRDALTALADASDSLTGPPAPMDWTAPPTDLAVDRPGRTGPRWTARILVAAAAVVAVALAGFAVTRLASHSATHQPGSGGGSTRVEVLPGSGLSVALPAGWTVRRFTAADDPGDYTNAYGASASLACLADSHGTCALYVGIVRRTNPQAPHPAVGADLQMFGCTGQAPANSSAKITQATPVTMASTSWEFRQFTDARQPACTGGQWTLADAPTIQLWHPGTVDAAAVTAIRASMQLARRPAGALPIAQVLGYVTAVQHLDGGSYRIRMVFTGADRTGAPTAYNPNRATHTFTVLKTDARFVSTLTASTTRPVVLESYDGTHLQMLQRV